MYSIYLFILEPAEQLKLFLPQCYFISAEICELTNLITPGLLTPGRHRMLLRVRSTSTPGCLRASQRVCSGCQRLSPGRAQLIGFFLRISFNFRVSPRLLLMRGSYAFARADAVLPAGKPRTWRRLFFFFFS